jgi:hypothetical protein
MTRFTNLYQYLDAIGISLIIRVSQVQALVSPLNNQALTIYFVGGFFFGASLVPGFEEKVGGNCHLSRFYSNNDKRNSRDSTSP